MDYSQRRKEQAQKTETAILDAALALMRTSGFEAVTVRDICQKAGITTGAFYHHFRSKEELFSKGFSPLDQHMKKVVDQRPQEDPTQRLKCILENYALFIENCGELVAQYYQRRIMNPGTESMDSTRFVRKAMINCFVQASEMGVKMLRDDPVWTADFCYCHFRGIVIDWLLHKRSYSLQDRMMENYAIFEQIIKP